MSLLLDVSRFHVDLDLPRELWLGTLVLVAGFLLKASFFKDERYIEADSIFVKVSKLPLAYLKPPSTAEAVSESPPTVSGVQLQIVVQRDWAVFSFCLDVGGCLRLCVRLIFTRWLRKCFDSSVLICITSAAFQKIYLYG